MVPWLTRSADNSRSGWNPHETQLTQASVESKGIIRATIIPVIGDARGVEAQPLILPRVKTARGIRDVMVLPSMADVARRVDAHDGSGIWQVRLGTPVTGARSIDSKLINQFWGASRPATPRIFTPVRFFDPALGSWTIRQSPGRAKENCGTEVCSTGAKPTI
jgi:hypothetical protein